MAKRNRGLSYSRNSYLRQESYGIHYSRFSTDPMPASYAARSASRTD